jgi:hypothetical protein
MNRTLELPGLREDNPRDFLTALGLLRLIDLLWPDSQAKLSWNKKNGFPEIHTTVALTEDWGNQLLFELKKLAEHDESPCFHGDVIKTETEHYRSAVEKAHQFTQSLQPFALLPQLLYACYAGQLPDENDGKTEPTAFSFANGQGGKNLLRDVKELILSIDPINFENSLLDREDPIPAKSMRWNPKEYRPAAYRAHNPGTKLKGDETLDFPAFNILAFFGLTFYPSVPTSKGSKTLGFSGKRGPEAFYWPIWETPLEADSLLTLLCLPVETFSRQMGVSHVWSSRRFSADKSLYFAPAIMIS